MSGSAPPARRGSHAEVAIISTPPILTGDPRELNTTKEWIRSGDAAHRLSHVSLSSCAESNRDSSSAWLQRVAYSSGGQGSSAPEQKSLLDGGSFDFEEKQLTELLKTTLDVTGTPSQLVARGKYLVRQASRGPVAVDREFRVFHGKRVVWRWRTARFEEQPIRVAQNGTQVVFFAHDVARVAETTISKHKNLVESLVTLDPRFPTLTDVEAISAHGLFLVALQARMPVLERLYKWAEALDHGDDRGEAFIMPPDFESACHPYQQLISTREAIEREMPTLLGGTAPPCPLPVSPTSPSSDGDDAWAAPAARPPPPARPRPGPPLPWAHADGWSPEARPPWGAEAAKELCARSRRLFGALLETPGWAVSKVSPQGTPVYERPPDAKEAAAFGARGAPLRKATARFTDVSCDQVFAAVWETGRRLWWDPAVTEAEALPVAVDVGEGGRDLALRHIKLEYAALTAPMASFRPRDLLLLVSFYQDLNGDYVVAGCSPSEAGEGHGTLPAATSRSPPLAAATARSPTLASATARSPAGQRRGPHAAAAAVPPAGWLPPKREGFVRARGVVWGFQIRHGRGCVEVTALEQVDLRAKAPVQVEEAARDALAARLHHLRRAILTAAPSVQRALPREGDEEGPDASPRLLAPLARPGSSPSPARPGRAAAARDPSRLLAPTAASLAPPSPEVRRGRSASLSPAPVVRRASTPSLLSAPDGPGLRRSPAAASATQLPFLTLEAPPLRRRASHAQ